MKLDEFIRIKKGDILITTNKFKLYFLVEDVEYFSMFHVYERTTIHKRYLGREFNIPGLESNATTYIEYPEEVKHIFNPGFISILAI